MMFSLFMEYVLEALVCGSGCKTVFYCLLDSLSETEVHWQEEVPLGGCPPYSGGYGGVGMEGFQRTMIPVQKFFRAHPVWFKNHIVCVIARPVAVYYPVFGIQFVVKACAGVWCKYRKIGYLKFCLDGKFNRSLKNSFIIMVKTKDKGAVNSDTVIMHLFDNIKIIIRFVKTLPHPRKIVSG